MDEPWLADLSRPEAYPDDPYAAHGIERIDTHISHVFLTRGRVYKLRRPVRLAFLDFSSREERDADAMREVELNRRLAPDVYLGIAPLVRTAGGVCVGPMSERLAARTSADVVEHCVVMRRLPAGHDLRSMIERGAATPDHVDRIASSVARFHREHSLGTPAPFAADDWLARTTGPARANFDALLSAPSEIAPRAEIEGLRDAAARIVDARRGEFDARRTSGRVVDGHGDLHAEHVWFERDDGEPTIVDCIEFREDFRRIDAASDIAFLAMDLAYRGCEALGARLLRRYARDSGDYHLFSVVDYFLAYRALVRAKVSSLVATDPSLPGKQRQHAIESVRGHLDLAGRFLAPKPVGTVVLVCGMIGGGKSTVAEEVAERTAGVALASDRLRQPADASSDDGAPSETADNARYREGRYSDDGRGAVYARMLAEARHVVRSGRTAILDATFSRTRWRNDAAAWARTEGCRAFLVEVVASRDETLTRLAAREARGSDPSEAGPALYEAFRTEYEPPAEWPDMDRATIDTGRADWRDQLDAAIARLEATTDAAAAGT